MSRVVDFSPTVDIMAHSLLGPTVSSSRTIGVTLSPEEEGSIPDFIPGLYDRCVDVT